MSKKVDYKSYIEELIKEVEDELDESTATGNVDGYQTPFAFSGNRARDKKKAQSNIDVTGYTKVKDIDETLNEAEINAVKKVINAIFKKNRIKKVESYSTSVRGFRKYKGSGYEYTSVGSVSLININPNVVKDLANQMKKAGVIVTNVYSNGIDFNNKELDWDLLSLHTESLNEAKSKRPVNRWLELKNDESMHPNKKLAVGLKELKYQLSEVETFFRWYNQIKTMNELTSDTFWKRTHSHIYKIKERLVNIAKTIQEIEH
jgi:hypothetical protein